MVVSLLTLIVIMARLVAMLLFCLRKILKVRHGMELWGILTAVYNTADMPIDYGELDVPVSISARCKRKCPRGVYFNWSRGS